jgi:hypothetical protein
MLVKTRQDSFILTVFAVWAFTKSFFMAQVIPLNHLDGAFQTASALIRFGSNSVVGKDFFPYLGIGPLIMHWPFFKLLGSSVSAATAASQFLTLILLVVSLSLLLHIILRQAPLRSFAIGSLVVMVSWYVIRIFPLASGLLDPLLQPGNSLRPIRASLPYIAGWGFIGFRSSGFSRFVQTLLYSIVLGACLLWSNDYALPTTLIFGIGWAFSYYATDSLHITSNFPALVRKIFSKSLILGFLSRLILIFAASAASYAVLLIVVTVGHPIEFLRYNYLDVGGDQWWYFSPYESSSRVFNVMDIANVLANSKYGLFLVFLGISPIPLLILLYRTKYIVKLYPYLLVFALTGVSLLSGGLLSCIGGHYSPGYLSYFAFWGLSSSIIVLFAIVKSTLDARMRLYYPVKGIAAAFGLAVLPLSFGAMLIEAGKGVAQRNNLFDRSDYAYVSSLGGFIPEEYRQALGSIGAYVKKGGVQEEYFGLTSAYHGSRGYYPVDSLIHLLGTLRKNYKARALPEMVIVTNPSYSHWQSWSMSQNWWFYKKIIGSYELFRSLPTIDVYKRKAGRFTKPTPKAINCNWVQSESSLVFESDAPPGLYSVSIKYTPMGGRVLLLIENRISIPTDAHGYVSIDPLAGASEFPIVMSGSVGEKMNVRLLGNFQNQRIEIWQCTAIRIANIEDRFLSGSYFNRVAGKGK